MNLIISNRYKLLRTAGTMFATAIIANLRNKRANRARVTFPKAKEPGNEPPAEQEESFTYSAH